MENQINGKLNITQKLEDVNIFNSQEIKEEIVSLENSADKTMENIGSGVVEVLSEGVQKIDNGSKSLNATEQEIEEGKKGLAPVQEKLIALKEVSQEGIEEKSFLEKNLNNLNEVFTMNPELATIGTPEQYSEYLTNMFPDSVVKDIVWHGSRNSFDKFRDTTIKFFGMNLNRGTYFSNNLDHAKFFSVGTGNIYPAMINMKKPFKPLFDHVLFSEKQGDGFINRNKNDANIGAIDEYAIFDSSQIHILGNKSDAEAFKSWNERNASLIK